MSNFFNILQRRMTASSSRVFMQLDDGSEFSYKQADKLSAQMANKLTSLGLAPGSRITAQVEKSPQAVILFLACMRAGFIFHPLNTAYTLHELEYFLEDAKPSVVVCDPSNLDTVRDLAERHKTPHIETMGVDGKGTLWESLDNCDGNFKTVWRDRNDTALLIYTSGTTGKPKGAMITHRNLAFNSHSMVQVWKWEAEDILVHVLPLFHIHGLCFALLCPIMCGSRILFQQRFSVTRTIELLAQATAMMAVPTVYTRLLGDERFNRTACANIRIFISGSAPMLSETFNEIEQRCGHQIVERYGMSEAQIIASNPIEGIRRAGTVGTAIPQVHLRVCDENGSPVPSGQPGILEVKGPNVFQGYWRNIVATQKAIRTDGYFITGDIVTMDDDGIVTIVGRASDLIVSGGFNIYPKEIEIQLNRIDGISDCAVIGAAHPDLGEGVVAVVVSNTQELGETSVVNALTDTLSGFKIPKKFVFVDELPTNAMGKVEKNALREQYKNVFANETD